MNNAPSSSRTYGAYNVSSYWSEGSVTWNNQPSASSTVTNTISTGTNDGVWISWDVKIDVVAFHNASSTISWKIKDQTENNNSSISADFRSSEYGTSVQRPQLEIVYTVPPTTITVNKVLVPSNDPGKFNLRIDGNTAGTGINVGNGGTTGAVTVASSTHTVSETAGTGTDLNDYTAVISGNCETNGLVTLSTGEEKTCTITNTRKTGTIKIIKNTIGGDAIFGFTVSGQSSSTPSITTSSGTASTTVTVNTGIYGISESPLIGWDNTGASCDSGTPASFSVNSGETVICTFTNTKRGALVVTKITEGDDGEFSFNGSGGIGDFSITTASSSGTKTFTNLIPSTYSISETVPDGWDQNSNGCSNAVVSAGTTTSCVITNTKRGSITIEKIAERDAGPFVFTLSGLLGQPATYANGSFSTEATTTSYTFSNLVKGIYQLFESVPENWSGQRSIDCDVATEGSSAELTLTLIAGGNVHCTYNNTEYSVISGMKFEDSNANHEKDGGEGGLDGWSVTITKFSDILPTELLSDTATTTTTANGGFYAFTNILPGIYQVCEVAQGGFVESYPIADPITENAYMCPDGSQGYRLTVTAGSTHDGNDFGNYQNGSIKGYKFEDLNGDGEWHQPNGATNEPGIAEWTIYIDANNNGTFDVGETSTTTIADGSYMFSDLAPGSYVIREVSQGGWRETRHPGSEGYSIVVTSGHTSEGNDFGNFRLAVITGYKWSDVNANGVLDEGEHGIAGWTISLHGNDRNENTVSMSTTTDATGAFSFFDVFASMPNTTYQVTEASRENYERTSSDASFNIAVTSSGQTISSVGENMPIQFGNVYFVDVLGLKFAPYSGDAASTTQALVLGDAVIRVPQGTGTSTITLSASTTISRVDGGILSLGDLSAGSVPTESLSGLGAGSVVDGALQWGISNLGLQFSTPITIKIFVGIAFDGQILDIVRSTSGSSGWTGDGIGLPATCVVTNGLCSFTATKASYYAVTHIIAVDTTPTPTTAVIGGGGGPIWEYRGSTTNSSTSNSVTQTPSVPQSVATVGNSTVQEKPKSAPLAIATPVSIPATESSFGNKEEEPLNQGQTASVVDATNSASGQASRESANVAAIGFLGLGDSMYGFLIILILLLIGSYGAYRYFEKKKASQGLK